MHRLLRFAFFAFVVRPVSWVLLGINVRHRDRLPKAGPAILCANHNSHLDTWVLMSLLPLRLLPHIRPVAAADYFLRSPTFAWFFLNIVGVLPLQRGAAHGSPDPLQPLEEALRRGDLLILFPEGSRGEPEQRSEFKSGIAHLARRVPDIPVIPIYLHGCGKALPRGEGLLVPFCVDVFVGTPLAWTGDRTSFMNLLQSAMSALAAAGDFPPWT